VGNFEIRVIYEAHDQADDPGTAVAGFAVGQVTQIRPEAIQSRPHGLLSSVSRQCANQ
jgi:hypothetical protein